MTQVLGEGNVASGEPRYHIFSLPRFSGQQPTPKSESSFRVWNHTLQCLKEEEQLSESSLKQIIRKSLTGEAAEALVTLATSATSDQIISELKDLYSTNTARFDGWSLFHAAKQTQTESVTEWKVRLMRLFDDANANKKFNEHRDQMLATAFWQNLQNKDLRMATSADRSKSFNSLFRCVKENELLYAVKQPKPAKATTNTPSEIVELRKEMDKLKMANDELRTIIKKQAQKKSFVPTCFGCGVEGHTTKTCPERPKRDYQSKKAATAKVKCEFCFRSGHTQEMCFVYRHHKDKGNM